MKFNAVAAALSAALLTAGVHAEDDQKVVKEESSSVAETPTVAPEMPTFTPTVIKAPFLEQFTEGWEKRWKPSHAKKDLKGTDKESEEWAYIGEWAAEEPYVYPGMEGDKGLVAKTPAAHHAISAKFPKKIDPKGKTLVVQYEAKFQKGLDCGGAYLKLLKDTKALHQDEFSNTTPYVIMFGPDKCGVTNKIHFIFNHKNPKTGVYEEKQIMLAPSVRLVKTTELYTLIVHPNNTYIIKQNGEGVKNGSLFEDFNPAVNPQKEIDDPKDTKPEDWVDDAKIPDPDAKKPDDWDEDAPFEIVDEDAKKPDDWLENEELQVSDPEAQKPEDWDDEEDGDWVAPKIPNPKCAEAAGCGPWTKPMKNNPDYKGTWTAPIIDNPAFKGYWSPRQIKNPDYYEDKHPANFEPMGAIGFEIWTMQSDILFDNIYIGHSVEDAEKLAQETFFLKHPIEQLAETADKPKEDAKTDKPASPSDLKFMDDPVTYIKEKVDLFVTLAKKDPMEAIRFVPEVAGGIAALLFTVIAIVIGSMGGGASPVPAAKKAESDVKAKDGKDKMVDTASATGTESDKDKVSKRSTRSQS